MDPVLIVLTFIILQNVGDFTSACSVLPSGTPKCFPDAVDYNAKSQLADIKFRLDKHHIYGYDTNKGKRDVRLGQFWEKRLGKKSSTLTCQKEGSEETYLPEFTTHLYDYHRVDNKVEGKKEVTDFFIITKKEVWLCKDYMANKKGIEFKRVVTELVSREPLGSIFFFDGIEVTSAPLPYHEHEKDSRLNTAIVREVKYIDHLDNNKVVRYEGHLKFVTPKKNEDESVFKRVIYNPQTYDENSFHREVPEALNLKKFYYGLNNEKGIDLEDIHRPYGLIGHHDSKATCKISDKDSRLYKVEYLPKWAQRVLGEEGYRQQEMYLSLFKSHFIVTKHEIWSCTMEDGGFERHVMEYIGTEPLKTIDCFNGNEVWQYDMDKRQANEKSVAVKAVFYFDGKEPFQKRIYDGLLRLEKIVIEKKPVQKKSFWSSLFSSKEQLPEGQYKLKYNEKDDKTIFNRPR